MDKSGCDCQNINEGDASKCCPGTTVNEDLRKRKHLLMLK